MHKPLFSNALGNMQCPQEHLKTIVYAKFGGQTKCIMGNSKIEIRGRNIDRQKIINEIMVNNKNQTNLFSFMDDEFNNVVLKITTSRPFRLLQM